MTTPIARPSHAIKPTQNTAPVYEFHALYTHDLRRKQKRWQDGTLRFHTFNKRIMVYDTTGNLIGDTHWKESASLQDGDELELEVGVLVQVGECTGTQETDLRGLFEKPKRGEREQAQTERNCNTQNAPIDRHATRLPPPALPARPEHLKHKSLNALLGTPKGVLGKAVLPVKSPYEINNGAGRIDERAAKRQKVGGDHAWNITRTTTPTHTSKGKETSLRTRQVDARSRATSKVPAKQRAALASGQRRLGVTEVIDITSENDDENLASEITLPETPRGLRSATPILKPKRIPAVPLTWRKVDSPLTEIQPSSPPISTKNRIHNVEANAPHRSRDGEHIEFQDITEILSPERLPQLKLIKLAKVKPRNKLVCAKPSPKLIDKAAKYDSLPTEKRSSSVAKPKSKRQNVTHMVEFESSLPSSPIFSTMCAQDAERRLSPAKANEQTFRNAVEEQDFIPKRRTSAVATGVRNFHRVQSENDAPAFVERGGRGSVADVDQEPPEAVAGRPPAGKLKQAHSGKKPMKRSLSENEGIRNQAPSNIKGHARGATECLEKQKDQEKGAWTVEALDFFDWRPPDWQERQKRKDSRSSNHVVQVAG